VIFKIWRGFWSKVEKTDNCWIWTAGKNHDGYGMFWLDGRNQKAHRVAYQLTKGSISEGLVLLHKCDNPFCVNPDHLTEGTRQENTQDMVNKGRHLHGTDHPLSKLTEANVVSIRHEYCHLSSRKIADIFGVSKTVILKILSNRVWKHLQ
jgi:hypothetical protein